MTIQRDWSTGLAAGSTGIAFIGYNGTTKSAGKFDGGTTAPSNTTRLNYDGNFYATTFYGSGVGLSNTTVPIASINASGTANSTTFLRGDGQWITVSVPVTSVVGQTGAVTATQVRDALLAVDGSGSGLDADLLDGQQGSYYATMSALNAYVDNNIGVIGVGMMLFGSLQGATTLAVGSTISGTLLYPMALESGVFSISASPIGVGTWRNIGFVTASGTVGSWFQRIS